MADTSGRLSSQVERLQLEIEKLKRIRDIQAKLFTDMNVKTSTCLKERIKNSVIDFQHQLGIDNTIIYLYDKWKQQYYPVYATKEPLYANGNKDVITLRQWGIFKEQVLKNQAYVCDYDGALFPSVACMMSHCAVFPLLEDGHMYGFMMIESFNKVSTTNRQLFFEVFPYISCILYKTIREMEIYEENKRYQLLYAITKKFYSTMGMEEVLKEIINALYKIYPHFHVLLLLTHDSKSDPSLPIKHLQFGNGEISELAETSYFTGEVQYEDNVTSKESYLYAPLKGKQGTYGVLEVKSPYALVFPDEEVQFISLLANAAGNALENAQLYQQSQQLISDLQLINDTSKHLNSNLRLQDIIHYMVRKITESFQAEQVGFFMFNDPIHTKVLQGSTDFFIKNDHDEISMIIRKRIDKAKDALFYGDLSQDKELSQFNYRSLLAIPMSQNHEFIGMVLVLHSNCYWFTFEKFKLLQSLIHHSTLAFSNAILHEELEKMVITDHLTTLYSRNYLDEKIQESMSKDSYGCFILIDIDNFKSVNDTYGHQVGDEIIIKVATVMKENTRQNDIAARWGGEELAIYLPNVSKEIGMKIAHRLVKIVEKETEPKITISCGVSYWLSDQRDSVKKLFNRADQALYLAKNNGKNRAIIQE